MPRTRDQVTTKELPEFAHLRAHVYRAIKRPDSPVGVALGPEHVQGHVALVPDHPAEEMRDHGRARRRALETTECGFTTSSTIGRASDPDPTSRSPATTR